MTNEVRLELTRITRAKFKKFSKEQMLPGGKTIKTVNVFTVGYVWSYKRQRPFIRISNDKLNQCGFIMGAKFEVIYGSDYIILKLK